MNGTFEVNCLPACSSSDHEVLLLNCIYLGKTIIGIFLAYSF